MYYCCHLLVLFCTCTIFLKPFMFLCVRVSVCANFLLTAGLLDRLHSDDPVCACGFLHPGGLHPDDCVGQRQTPQLLKGVQGLSNPPLFHPPIHPLEPGTENDGCYKHPSSTLTWSYHIGPLHPLEVRKFMLRFTAGMDFGRVDSYVTFSQVTPLRGVKVDLRVWWMQGC